MPWRRRSHAGVYRSTRVLIRALFNSRYRQSLHPHADLSQVYSHKVGRRAKPAVQFARGRASGSTMFLSDAPPRSRVSSRFPSSGSRRAAADCIGLHLLHIDRGSRVDAVGALASLEEAVLGDEVHDEARPVEGLAGAAVVDHEIDRGPSRLVLAAPRALLETLPLLPRDLEVADRGANGRLARARRGRAPGRQCHAGARRAQRP